MDLEVGTLTISTIDPTIRSYSELIQLETFIDRYRYLKMESEVGLATFGFDRYLNQRFYKTKEWLRLRDHVIVRDLGCDLAVEDLEIVGTIIIHHLNAITIDDIKRRSRFLLDPEFLITTRLSTHNAIHYGDEGLILSSASVERSPNDTKLW